MFPAILLIASISYLLGSIPIGYLLVRIFRRQDIRDRVPGGVLDPAEAAHQLHRLTPGAGCAAATAICPVVIVPVLSTTIVSTGREASSAW